MRRSARLLQGLCGVALLVPATVKAAPLGGDGPSSAPAGAQAAQAQPQPQPQAQPHHHKGLFGRRHCVECQRAYAKAHDGIDIPPPPDLGPLAGTAGHVHNGQPGDCPTCQGAVVVSGPMTSGDPHAPGYAVTTGPVMVAGAEPPGYAVVGETVSGPEPSPIGVSRSGQPSWADPRMSAAGSRPAAGPMDPSVMPAGMPPAQVALTNPGHERPHIISHLLGLPKFGAVRRAREDEARQKHASIAYDQPDRPVTSLPASVVYGNGSR